MNVNASMPLTEILRDGMSLAIDCALAERILSECKFDGQRKLDDERAFLHAERMDHGTFLQNSQIAFGHFGARFYLLNGQHRMAAVTLAGKPCSFRVEVYNCASVADLHSIYCRFDQPGSQRSLTQVSGSLGLHDDEPGGLKKPMAALLLRAMPFLMTDLKRVPIAHRPRSTRDLDAKKSAAVAWKPAAIQYQGALALGVAVRTARFRNSGVVAVALATFRYQSSMALTFWGSAIRNDGLHAGDPRQTLVNDFLQRPRTSHEFDLAEAVSVAWNAFYQHRQIKIIKVMGSPVRLLGTPYTGE